MWTITPDRRRNGQRDAVGHAVRDADELDAKRADGDGFARLDRLEAIAGIDGVLLELGLDQRQRHGRAVDRSVEQRQHVRHGADVVLVAVRQDQRTHLVRGGLRDR